ncbi:MAG: hypothetical protein WD333_05895 [Dehalococcoidia bacterium]
MIASSLLALARRFPVSPWPLAALTMVVMILAAVGVLPRWPGLIHMVALPPMAEFTDLRILVTRAPSYPIFIIGLVLSVAVRITVLALLLGGLDRARISLAIRFYLVALPLGLLAATFLYAAGATLFYALFWVGLLGVVVFFIALAALPWMRDAGFLPKSLISVKSGLRAGTVVAYLGLLIILGGVADLAGPVGTVLLVPVSAALTFVAANALVANPGLRVPRRIVATGTLAAFVALAAVLLTGASESPDASPTAETRPDSLLIMSGVDSSSGQGVIFSTNPHLLGFTCEQTYYYSYAGPGDGVPQESGFCPIRTGAPYFPGDTLRPSDELVEFLLQQAAELPEPVVVAGHSQAAWIMWKALAENDPHGISALVLVGTFPANPVGYPPDLDHGPGRVGAEVAYLLSNLPRPGGTTAFDPAAPLAREFLADAGAIERLMSRPLPADVRVLSITSVSDLPLMPDGWRVDEAEDACPMALIHPHIPWAEEYHTAIDRFLDGEPMPRCAAWKTAIGVLTRPFAVPPYDA